MMEKRAMFGGKQETRRTGLSVIGADVTIIGNVVSDGDLHIDGTVEGDVRCKTLVQGGASRIIGTITAKSARIAGAVDGEIDVAALTIETGARIVGDSTYTTLSIATGAQVDGRMTHADATAVEPSLRLIDRTDAAT